MVSGKSWDTHHVERDSLLLRVSTGVVTLLLSLVPAVFDALSSVEE